MMPKLKLFRSTSGIEDAYVAATSRPKALAAFGARTDLFALGIAAQVDDQELLGIASKHPGTVYRKRRDSSEIIKAVGDPKPRRLAKASAASKRVARLKDELLSAEKKRDAELKQIDAEIERLKKRRSGEDAKHARLLEGLRRKLDSALGHS